MKWKFLTNPRSSCGWMTSGDCRFSLMYRGFSVHDIRAVLQQHLTKENRAFLKEKNETDLQA